MSGGHFGYDAVSYEVDGAWRDAEIDGLVSDLFFSAEFSVRGYGGLLQSLDFWLSADIGEEGYRDAVSRFKAKWFEGSRSERLKGYVDDEIERTRKELYALIGVDES